MSGITQAIKNVVDYFCDETQNYMKDEERLKAIRLNINFIHRHPDLFQFVMRGPTDVFFGHAVRAKSLALKTEYKMSRIDKDDELWERIKKFEANEAFDELAAYWRLSIAQGNTILPYVPIQTSLSSESETFQPVIRFRTVFGTIDATQDSEPFAD